MFFNRVNVKCQMVVAAVSFLLCACANTERTDLSDPQANNHNCSKTITVSGMQMLVTKDVAKNEKSILAAIKKAANEGSDFLITPEGSLSGYTVEFDRQQVAQALERVVASAKKHKVGLLLGTCYKELIDNKEHCYNQVRVYTPQGDYLGAHDKILRCSSLSMPGSGEMADYEARKLQIFEWKGIRFGVLICNDLWASPGYTTIPNPYLPWKLKQMGAQIIFHAIHSGTKQSYRAFSESSVELWAKSLEIYIVEVNADEGTIKILTTLE